MDVFRESKVPEFLAKNSAAVNAAMAHYAQVITITIKTTRTPMKGGDLRSTTNWKKVGDKHYQVTAPQPYAAVQEAGERKGAKFSNYTTPGTGPKWFEGAIKANEQYHAAFMVTHLRSVGIDVKST